MTNTISIVNVGYRSTNFWVLSASRSRLLVEMRAVSDWDVAPDGRRFIVIRDRQGQRRKLILVENVFQELRARLAQP